MSRESDCQRPESAGLDQGNEFYADITLLERRADFYSQSLPRPRDVLLVVEVSDTTGRYDRRVKAPRYARAGVSELWIVDLSERVIVVHRRPAGDQYLEQQAVGPDASVTISGVAAAPIAAADVLV